MIVRIGNAEWINVEKTYSFKIGLDWKNNSKDDASWLYVKYSFDGVDYSHRTVFKNEGFFQGMHMLKEFTVKEFHEAMNNNDRYFSLYDYVIRFNVQKADEEFSVI